jgi:hypothetical protein
MNEVKTVLAAISLVMAIITAVKGDYEWSRHFTLITIIITMGV